MSEMQPTNETKKKAPLGRGLGSLLSGGGMDALPATMTQAKPLEKQELVQKPATAAPVAQIPPESRIWTISIDKLNPNEYQPRQKFVKESIEELANSIKEKGILQPITARRHTSGSFEIIAGERRWRAAQLAGLHEVPVIIKNTSDQEALEYAIIENVQREDLNPVDEAEAYQRLATEFNLTQQQVAEKVGKDRATVANCMRLLALPEQIKEMLVKSEISVGHAKVLLSVPDLKKQIEIAKKAASAKLSVRATEKLIASESSSSTTQNQNDLSAQAQLKDKLVQKLAEDLQKSLGTKVTIEYSNSKGKISLAFYSDEQLNQLAEKLKEL